MLNTFESYTHINVLWLTISGAASHSNSISTTSSHSAMTTNLAQQSLAQQSLASATAQSSANPQMAGLTQLITNAQGQIVAIGTPQATGVCLVTCGWAWHTCFWYWYVYNKLTSRDGWLSYLTNYSCCPVMHAGLCLLLFILYGESRVICTPTILKLTWPWTSRQENAFCSTFL